MSYKPLVIGMDFGSEDGTTLGMRWIYTLAKGESVMATDRGFVVVHPDNPPKIVTSDGVEEITL